MLKFINFVYGGHRVATAYSGNLSNGPTVNTSHLRMPIDNMNAVELAAVLQQQYRFTYLFLHFYKQRVVQNVNIYYDLKFGYPITPNRMTELAAIHPNKNMSQLLTNLRKLMIDLGHQCDLKIMEDFDFNVWELEHTMIDKSMIFEKIVTHEELQHTSNTIQNYIDNQSSFGYYRRSGIDSELSIQFLNGINEYKQDDDMLNCELAKHPENFIKGYMTQHLLNQLIAKL